MTGYGKANGNYASKTITVEIKSLNSKLFDLNTKLPAVYREKELLIRSLLSEKLGRGKVDLNISIEDAEGQMRVSINQPLALAYLNEINHLAKAGNLPADAHILSTLMEMPDVLQPAKELLDEDEWLFVENLIVEAADALMDFRKMEGAHLEEDIRERVKAIENLRIQVSDFLPERLLAVRERIEKNVSEFVQDETDKNRLEQEIIYYLEKLDITEEHTRLNGHCTYFLETMREDGMVGKKLAFITQEMGREINTMGSKANYVPIQKLVVEMKDELEKIKEQLLNIC